MQWNLMSPKNETIYCLRQLIEIFASVFNPFFVLRTYISKGGIINGLEKIEEKWCRKSSFMM